METLMVTYDGVNVKHISDKVYALNIRNGECAGQLVINVTIEQRSNCKYFYHVSERSHWLSERNKFIDYVLSFYGEGEIYSHFFGNGLSRDEVMFATNAIDKAELIDMGESVMQGYDSFSRELVRDYIFLCKGKVDVEYDLVRVWFLRNCENKVVEHLFLVGK